MRYRKLDANGDYTFGRGKTDFYVDCPEAVGQAIGTRLRLWREEWFLDNEEGTPYTPLILGKYTEASRDLAIRSRIAGTQGVTAIAEYESIVDPEERRLTVNATVDTIYGQIRIQEIL